MEDENYPTQQQLLDLLREDPEFVREAATAEGLSSIKVTRSGRLLVGIGRQDVTYFNLAGFVGRLRDRFGRDFSRISFEKPQSEVLVIEQSEYEQAVAL